jgi:hypothetical protein
MKTYKGKFLGLDKPFGSGCWGLIVKTGKKTRTFWGDWRPIRDGVEISGIKKDDPIIIHYNYEWDWSWKPDET